MDIKADVIKKTKKRRLIRIKIKRIKKLEFQKLCWNRILKIEEKEEVEE